MCVLRVACMLCCDLAPHRLTASLAPIADVRRQAGRQTGTPILIMSQAVYVACFFPHLSYYQLHVCNHSTLWCECYVLMYPLLTTVISALKVFLSNAAWLDVAASFAQQQDAHLEEPDDERDDREAEGKSDAHLSSNDDHGEAAAAIVSGHAAAGRAGRVSSDQVPQSAPQDTVQAEQASSLQEYDNESGGASATGSMTLIVRKGQQVQELLVDGIISRDQLKREVEQIVSYMVTS